MGALIRFREGLGKACLVEVPAAQGPGPTPGAGSLPGGSHVICAQPAPPHVTLIATPAAGSASDNDNAAHRATSAPLSQLPAPWRREQREML